MTGDYTNLTPSFTPNDISSQSGYVTGDMDSGYTLTSGEKKTYDNAAYVEGKLTIKGTPKVPASSLVEAGTVTITISTP